MKVSIVGDNNTTRSIVSQLKQYDGISQLTHINYRDGHAAQSIPDILPNSLLDNSLSSDIVIIRSLYSLSESPIAALQNIMPRLAELSPNAKFIIAIDPNQFYEHRTQQQFKVRIHENSTNIDTYTASHQHAFSLNVLTWYSYILSGLPRQEHIIGLGLNELSHYTPFSSKLKQLNHVELVSKNTQLSDKIPHLLQQHIQQNTTPYSEDLHNLCERIDQQTLRIVQTIINDAQTIISVNVLINETILEKRYPSNALNTGVNFNTALSDPQYSRKLCLSIPASIGRHGIEALYLPSLNMWQKHSFDRYIKLIDRAIALANPYSGTYTVSISQTP